MTPETRAAVIKAFNAENGKYSDHPNLVEGEVQDAIAEAKRLIGAAERLFECGDFEGAAVAFDQAINWNSLAWAKKQTERVALCAARLRIAGKQ